MMSDLDPTCAKCPYPWKERLCRIEDGKGLASCPTETKKELLEKSMQKYQDPQELRFAQMASIQEAEGYSDREKGYAFTKPIKPRILEIMEFAGWFFCFHTGRV